MGYHTTHHGEKPDSAMKSNGRAVWSSEDSLSLPELGLIYANNEVII